MNEKLNQVLLLVGETNFEDQNTSTVISAFCVTFLFNSDDNRQLHFHFPICFFFLLIEHVITFHCGFLTSKVALCLLATVRFEQLAYVVFRWCTSSSYPKVEVDTTWWWAMRRRLDAAGKKSLRDISGGVSSVSRPQRVASCAATTAGFLTMPFGCSVPQRWQLGKGIDVQMKLLDTKVQLNPEGALLCQPVGAYWLKCAQKENNNNSKHPLCRNRCFLPRIGSASSQTPPSFISFLCTACFRVVFVCRQVVFSSVRFFP